MDATELWRQWYERNTKMWSDMARGTQGSATDPYGLYRQWFDGMREMQERMSDAVPAMNGGATDGAGVVDTWRRWSEMSADGWRKGGELGRNAMEILPRWVRMLEQAQSNLVSEGAPPADPLQFATRWYNATSGPFSDFVGELLEREEFLKPSSQFLQSYASFYKVSKHNSEEYLKNLQLPVRSDVTRIAGLIVALEDKVDGIEEMLEDLGDAGATAAAIEAPEIASAESVRALEKTLKRIQKTSADAATAESVASLEERIGGIESALDRVAEAGSGAASADSVQALEGRLGSVEDKLDRLLTAFESSAQNSNAPAETQPEALAEIPASAVSNGSVEVSDAVRRKAREMGVDLTTVEGTGTDGKITVDDVRRKGDS